MKASEKAAQKKLKEYGVKGGVPQAPLSNHSGPELDGAVHTYKEGPIARMLGKRK